MTDTLFSNSVLLNADGLGSMANFDPVDLTGKIDKTVRKWCHTYGIGGHLGQAHHFEYHLRRAQPR